MINPEILPAARRFTYLYGRERNIRHKRHAPCSTSSESLLARGNELSSGRGARDRVSHSRKRELVVSYGACGMYAREPSRKEIRDAFARVDRAARAIWITGDLRAIKNTRARIRPYALTASASTAYQSRLFFDKFEIHPCIRISSYIIRIY